jgi:peptidyl-tRNA hydrolase, PTH1 family
MLRSVGHLIVDALASRLGVPMSVDKDLEGYRGHSNVSLGNATVSITLFKPSVYDT